MFRALIEIWVLLIKPELGFSGGGYVFVLTPGIKVLVSTERKSAGSGKIGRNVHIKSKVK